MHPGHTPFPPDAVGSGTGAAIAMLGPFVGIVVISEGKYGDPSWPEHVQGQFFNKSLVLSSANNFG
jgi:hypothetical protein